MNTTTRKVARLKSLAETSHNNLFEMVALAAEVLCDTEWVTANYQSEPDAVESLGKQFFPACAIGLEGLLDIYEKYPEQSKWAEYRYDVRAMHDLANPPKARKKPEGPSRADLILENQQLKLEVAELRRQLAELKLEMSCVPVAA